MTIRDQIIRDAMTGAIPGNPDKFIPSEEFIAQEMERRKKEQSKSYPTIPVSQDNTSDGQSLVDQVNTINDRLQDLGQRISSNRNEIYELNQESADGISKINRQTLKLTTEVDADEAIAPHSNRWTESKSDHFVDAENVDLLWSTADVDYESHSVSLPVDSKKPIIPKWLADDTGFITVESGPGENVRVTPGSTLRDLILGNPKIYTIEVDATAAGIIELSFVIPLPLLSPKTSTALVPAKLNRIELTVVGVATITPAIQVGTDRTWKDVANTTFVDGRTVWRFPEEDAWGIELKIQITAKRPGVHSVSLDDMGLFMEHYKAKASVVSKSLTFNDKPISHTSIHASDTVPENTSISYFVAIDPVVSGAFIDINNKQVPPGHNAIRYDDAINPSGRVPVSSLRRYSTIPGADQFKNWEPDWKPITDSTDNIINTVPSVVSFDNIESFNYPTGMISTGAAWPELVPLTINSGDTGWWRPRSGQGGSTLAGSSSFPDLSVNGLDFYRVYHWPKDNKPIPGSIRLNYGSELQRGEVSGSGHIWDLATTATPGLQDITIRGLTPSSSGTIEVDAPGTVLFDKVRELKYDGSQEPGFNRGDEYQVFGSGNFIELDVSVIEAVGDALDSLTRDYQFTYTVEKSSGVIDTYHYTSTILVSDDAEVFMSISDSSTIRRIQLAGLKNGQAIDTLATIEYPEARGSISVKLPTGYVRIVIQSDASGFIPQEEVIFNIRRGFITPVGVPFGMQEVPHQEHLNRTTRQNHSRFSIENGASGVQWLVVNDPGSEDNQIFDNLTIGPDEKSNPHGYHLFHPSASGVAKFYHLQYDTSKNDETNLLFKAELNTEDTSISPSLDSYRIDTGNRLNVIDKTMLSKPLDTTGFKG